MALERVFKYPPSLKNKLTCEGWIGNSLPKFKLPVDRVPKQKKPIKEPKHKRVAKKGVCHYCQQNERLTRDHVYPASKIRKHLENGEPIPVDLHENIVPACGWCNLLKGDKDYNEFIALGASRIMDMKAELKSKILNNRRRKIPQ